MEIISAAREPHDQFAQAHHPRDMRGRKDDDGGHDKRDPYRQHGLAADASHNCKQDRGQQDDDRDAGHVPEQGRADIIDAAPPGDVISGRKRVDDSDGHSHHCDAGVDEPVAACPAKQAARPGRPQFVPRAPFLIPNRLDAGCAFRILDVTHEAINAIWDRTMREQTISHQPAFNGTAERRVDLDWVRIGAFGLLIFYHVGMLYVSWGFHIKSAHRITALEPLMLVLNPWRLSLLFLVSGVATRFMFRKYALAPMLRSRTARLLIPLVFGMFVIVPPQSYDQIVEALGYPAGFVDFYLNHYLAFGAQFCPNPCIIMPTWNHLWFVVYLWVYTMALGVVMMAVPAVVRWIERWLVPVLSGMLLLGVPPLAFAAYRLVLLPSS